MERDKSLEVCYKAMGQRHNETRQLHVKFFHMEILQTRKALDVGVNWWHICGGPSLQMRCWIQEPDYINTPERIQTVTG